MQCGFVFGKMGRSNDVKAGSARFFSAPQKFRKWLEANHAKRDELIVGFYKMGSGKPSITWPESVDEALCFGWIDGVRNSLSDDSYCIRFTPRRPGSNWSKRNIERVAELRRQGRMQAAGLRVFQDRVVAKEGAYSFENREVSLDPAFERSLRANKKAWQFFSGQPPWYRRSAAFWVQSAKREDTRLRRFAALIEDSRAGRRVKPLRRAGEE